MKKYLSTLQAAEILDKQQTTIFLKLRNNIFPGARKVIKNEKLVWEIPEKEVLSEKKRLDAIAAKPRNVKIREKKLLQNNENKLT